MSKGEIELLKAKVYMLEQQVDWLMNGDQEVELEDDTPKRQTEEEWRNFARLWVDGVKLDYYDFSEGEHQWYPDGDEAFYRYDENIVYRVHEDEI